MKITSQPSLKNRSIRSRRQSRESGMATLIFITLLTIMLILAMAELRCVAHLHREVKLLEKEQLKRLNLATSHPATPAPAADKPALP